jgi:hypothetical protein
MWDRRITLLYPWSYDHGLNMLRFFRTRLMFRYRQRLMTELCEYMLAMHGALWPYPLDAERARLLAKAERPRQGRKRQRGGVKVKVKENLVWRQGKGARPLRALVFGRARVEQPLEQFGKGAHPPRITITVDTSAYGKQSYLILHCNQPCGDHHDWGFQLKQGCPR